MDRDPPGAIVSEAYRDGDIAIHLADGPAEFGGGGAGVGVAFFGPGADDAAGDFAVEACAVGGLEGFFHAAIFAGMEGEEGDAAAGVEALRQDAQ